MYSDSSVSPLDMHFWIISQGTHGPSLAERAVRPRSPGRGTLVVWTWGVALEEGDWRTLAG